MKIVSIDGSTSNTGIAVFGCRANSDKYKYLRHYLFSYEKEFGKPKYTKKKKGMTKTAYEALHTREKKEVMTKRVAFMIKSITGVLDEQNPSLVVMEDTYGQNDMNTLKMLSRIQGAVIIWVLTHGAEVVFKTPSQWRSHIGMSVVDASGSPIKRKQYKELAKLIVKQVYEIDVTDDEADAICIGLSMTSMLK